MLLPKMDRSTDFINSEELSKQPICPIIEHEVCHKRQQLQGRTGLLVLEEDGHSIRMASPFSGVATQHVIEAEGVRYYANCAWDALGVVAALQRPSTVYSRCEQSGEPLIMEVGRYGPGRSDWLFHCHVPAANWWDDIVFT